MTIECTREQSEVKAKWKVYVAIELLQRFSGLLPCSFGYLSAPENVPRDCNKDDEVD